MNAPRKLHRSIRCETRSEHTQTLHIPFKTMPHLIRNAALLLRRGFEHSVGCDVFDEVLTKIRGEVCKTFVSERLHSSHNRGRVNVVTLRHFARRQEKSLFVIVEDFSD